MPRRALPALLALAALFLAPMPARAATLPFDGTLTFEISNATPAVFAASGDLEVERDKESGALTRVSLPAGVFQASDVLEAPEELDPIVAITIAVSNGAVVLSTQAPPCSTARGGMKCGGQGRLRGRGGLAGSLKLGILGEATDPLTRITVNAGVVGAAGQITASREALPATVQLAGAGWTAGPATAFTTQSDRLLHARRTSGGTETVEGQTVLTVVTPMRIRSGMLPETTIGGMVHMRLVFAPEPSVFASTLAALLVLRFLARARRSRALHLLALVALAVGVPRAGEALLASGEILWVAADGHAYALNPFNGNQAQLTTVDTAFSGPLVGGPVMDFNGDVLGFYPRPEIVSNAAILQRFELDATPDRRTVVAAQLGGLTAQPGVERASGIALLHRRVLVVADRGLSLEIFPAGQDDGGLLLVNPATGTVRAISVALPSGKGLVNPGPLASDGERLYVADVRDGQTPPLPLLLRIDPVTGEGEQVAAGGLLQEGGVIDLAVLPDGDVLWLRTEFVVFTVPGDSEIVRIDAQTGAQTEVAKLSGIISPFVAPTGIAVSGDGRVYVSVPTDPSNLDPDTGQALGSAGAVVEVDIDAFLPGNPGANLSFVGSGGFLDSAPPIGLEVGGTSECRDGIDNHDDGIDEVDWPAHPGCAGPLDISEAFDCADGLDNDLDGRVDFGALPLNDPSCLDAEDGSEEPDCADRIDNDGDGFKDWRAIDRTADGDFDDPGELPADPECTTAGGRREERQCSDGIDNDEDGATDWPNDLGCRGRADDAEALTGCDDGVDNDGDGTMDYAGGTVRASCEADSDCRGAQSCVEGSCPPVQLDPDPDCNEDPAQSLEAPSGLCSDGLDNDDDGLIDLGGGLLFAACVSDTDCDAAQDCTRGFCQPGLQVGPDPECVSADSIEILTLCNDGLDNDGDGRVDFAGGDVVSQDACATDADCVAVAGCECGTAPRCGLAGCADSDYCDTSLCFCDANVCRIRPDPGCGSARSEIEDPQCDDGIDNEEQNEVEADDAIDYWGEDRDGDGQIDLSGGMDVPGDPACPAAWYDDESPQCNDGVDNNPDKSGGRGGGRDFQPKGYPCNRDTHCGYWDADVCDHESLVCLEVEEAERDCPHPWFVSEGRPPLCGLGAELVLLLPLAMGMRRRWRSWSARERVRRTSGLPAAGELFPLEGSTR